MDLESVRVPPEVFDLLFVLLGALAQWAQDRVRHGPRPKKKADARHERDDPPDDAAG